MDDNEIIQNIPLQERHTIKAVDDINNETYDIRPVETFGQYLISKMGFDEKKGIGRKGQIIKPIEFIPRNAKLGLGADPLNKQKNLVSQTGKNYNYIGEKLIDKNNPFVMGEQVEIITGKHKDLKGIVININEEIKELTIELKSGEKVKVGYKMVNKIKSKEKRKSSSSSSSSSSSEKKKKKKKKLKRLKWVHSNIRVRIINKKYRNSEFYNQKVIIKDVIDNYTFFAVSNNGISLEDLTEDDIETVMPKIGEKVVILVGQCKGRLGNLLARDKQKNQVIVQVHDVMEHIKLTQDDVCEYVS